MAFIPGLVTVLLHIHVLTNLSSGCKFDYIQLDASSLPKIQVPFHQNIAKRDVQTTSTNFAPIRIHTHYENQTNLHLNDFLVLQDVIQEAVAKVKTLISVIPVDGRLLLKRKYACFEKHITDFNQGKCSRLKPKYDGEFCENKVDKFKIPNAHLQGQEIYDANISSPLPSSIPSGEGIPDTDFILYVSAKRSNWCSQENLVSYATYCQLDLMDRPVAGFANFCPSYFSKGNYSRSHLLQSAVHEIFHTLGFSSELFSKYKDCQQINSKQRTCYNTRDPVRRDDEIGVNRLFLPTVAQQAEKHFSCDEDIGVPLEYSVRGVSSHWDPLVMYGSIMVPSFKENDEVLIDQLTLALFSDTGWYRVNYTAADDYTWAKGAGCDFQLSPECHKYPFLCNKSSVDNNGCGASPEGQKQCLPVSSTYPDCGIWQKNDLVCGYNDTDVRNSPFFALSISSIADGFHFHEHDNRTSIQVPIIISQPEKLGTLQHDTEKLRQLVLPKFKNQVGIPKIWILKSSLVSSNDNGSYILNLIIHHDSNSTEKEFDVIMERLQRFIPFKLDASDVVPKSNGDDADSEFMMKGWEAIVVLGGVILICFILAIIISSFIHIKGKTGHKLTILPATMK